MLGKKQELSSLNVQITRLLKDGPTRKIGLAWVALGVGLLLTVLVSIHVKHRIEVYDAAQMTFSYDQSTLKIHERLETYALILRGATGLFAALATVDRQNWQAYIEKLQPDKTIPGVQGIGFAQVIPPGQLTTHIAGIRQAGFPDYIVWPPGQRTITTAIVYLEPFRDRNLRAFGFDMFSEPVRRAAMERARDTGMAALSGKVELVQEIGQEVQAGTLMYVPVYRNGAAVDTLEQRQAALLGWVYSPYRMNNLMTDILYEWAHERGETLNLHIYDGLQATSDALLFDSQAALTPEGHWLFRQQRIIDFNGHQWLLVFDHTAAVAVNVNYVVAWSVLCGGIVLSGMLFGLIWDQSKLERLAHCDALTGLPNRLLLADRMRQAIAQAKRSGTRLAVGYLDLDGFKPVNDRYGHAAGDVLLIEIARRLEQTVRNIDTVARLGGDEFVVLMLELALVEESEAILNRILESVQTPIRLGAETVVVGASIGICLYPGPGGDNPDELLRYADQALYLAKQRGKNRYCFWDAPA